MSFLEVIFIGQSGFILRTQTQSLILDPYFSESVSAVRPEYRRMFSVPEEYQNGKYNYLLLSHCHLDHTDPETITGILKNNANLKIYGPKSSIDKLEDKCVNCGLRETVVPKIKYCLGDFEVTAFKTYHSDPMSLGYLIFVNDKTLCFTGDTLWEGRLLSDIPLNTNMLAVCMNGLGNNMNAKQAVELSVRTQTQMAVPVHWGMFDQPGADLNLFMNEAAKKGIQAYKPKPFANIPI